MASPILPPMATWQPASRSRCAVSAVVVDLPLVPVIPMTFALEFCASRWRKNSSVSPITSIPADSAFLTVQCGSGCVSGTPGASTSAPSSCQAALRRSKTGMPSASARLRLSSPSSQAKTRAPPACSALAAARPDRPRPKTAIVRSLNVVIGIMTRRSSRLQRRQADQKSDSAQQIVNTSQPSTRHQPKNAKRTHRYVTARLGYTSFRDLRGLGDRVDFSNSPALLGTAPFLFRNGMGQPSCTFFSLGCSWAVPSQSEGCRPHSGSSLPELPASY